MVYETDRQRVLLFGGFLENSQYCNETWEFDGQLWKRLNILSPSPDPGYALAYDSYRGVAILYGGSHRETWEFDGAQWNRVRCERRPPIISGGAMTYDPNRRVTVLFGGEMVPTRESVLPTLTDETWEYDGYGWTKRDVRGPSPRKYHQMVYDSARERFVVFGGFDKKPLNDTWELRLEGWRQVETATAPPARRGLALTYDPINRQTLLFGGFPGGDELWSFDGAQWSRIMAIHSPPYREGTGLVFLPTSRRVLVFGGLSTRLLNDSWVFVRPTPQPALALPPAPATPPEQLVLETFSPPIPWHPPREQIIPPILEPPSVGPESDLAGRTTTRPTVAERPVSPTPRPVAAERPPLPTSSTSVVRPKPTAQSVPPAIRGLAELHFKDVTVSPTTLTPNRALSLTGYLVNSGKIDATFWVEIWISADHKEYVRKHLLCQSWRVQVKSGQSYDLSQWHPVVYAGIPSGRVYIALEADRLGEVAEQDEANNVYMFDPVYTVSPAK